MRRALGEEPLEALAVTNQGDSMFLAMHAELVSAMHASGVTAVACMNLDCGPAHSRAVWLPWQIVSRGDRKCFASIFWAAIIRLPDTPATSSADDSINFSSSLICGLLRINDAIEMHFPSKRLETFGSILNGRSTQQRALCYAC